MNFLYAFLGLITGLMVAEWGGSYLLGAVIGTVIGILLKRLADLDQRVQQLESKATGQARASIPAWGRTPHAPVGQAMENESEPAPAPTVESYKQTPEKQAFEQDSDAGLSQENPWAHSSQSRPSQSRQSHEPAPVWLSRAQALLKKLFSWFVSGNLVAKVGVIISFFGVAFILKYAIDRELLIIPLELRLLTVAAGGIALLLIGWRLREKARVYALSLQGGGIGILFLTIFAALRIWQLLPASLAFFLLVALTFFTGALAVLQNSRSLAILGIAGGFLAPVLTSSGQGHHVTLFSYYLVLNGAILGIAWFRAWRELNLIGFVFTFVIGSFWGYQYYTPGLFASTQPFLVLYFLFYQAIAILYAQRQPPERLGTVDGTLVFGTPVIAFSLQAAMVHNMEYGLAISTAVAAVFYALLASWLFRKNERYLRLLTESYLALAVAFATITIPLALDARWTSASWALEGAALVWIGVRQGRQLAKLAGAALILFSGASFFDYGWRRNTGLAVLNGNVLGGVLISLGALFSSRKLGGIVHQGFRLIHKLAATVLFTWGVLWWFGTGFMEIEERLSSNLEPHVALLFLSLSMAATAWLGRKLQWSMLRRTSFFLLPMLNLFALVALWSDHHFLLDLGWLAWPVALLILGFTLRVMDEYEEKPAPVWHVGSLLFLTSLLALEAMWWTRQVASSAWAEAAAVTVMGSMAILVWRYRKTPDWPVPAHPLAYLYASLCIVLFQVLYLAVLSVGQTGDPAPWPYIPVLNPYDLVMLFAMLTSIFSLGILRRELPMADSGQNPQYLFLYKLLLAVAFFVMTTFALVRGVHHYTGVHWDNDALFSSVIVQTSLSIYWGLLGFAGMIWGARRAHRPVWLAGAGFMALVVIKLFLVDLGNTGTVERIISFIGIGVLLLVVGYLAPVPPRNILVSDVAEDENKDRIEP